MTGTRSRTLLVISIGLALAPAGCVGQGAPRATPTSGSTLRATWVDPRGSGVLEPGPGEPLMRRTALAPASPIQQTLTVFAQITDAHVLDEESPARVEMLDRLGPPFDSAFRPQESLTAQVLAAIVSSVDAVHPEAVFETGDLIDNAQANELALAARVLRGGLADPNSGGPGYAGVQSPSNPDPLIYRPSLDAPAYPGLLAAAERPFRSPGLTAPWYPLPGNHDLLVQGNLPATPATERIATGGRKLVTVGRAALAAARRRRLDPHVVARLLRQGLPGRWIEVPADPARRELQPDQAIAALRRVSGHGGHGSTLDTTVDLGPRVRAILLDTVDRSGGAVGRIRPAQVAWLRAQLRRARGRIVVVFSSDPLSDVRGGAAALAALAEDAHVVAVIAGDVHRNSIRPQPTPAGGYWAIATSSLIDYPQQARAFRLVTTANGGVALETWMLNASPASRLANISRELAYLDYQGGRPHDWAGSAGDRNAILYHAG
jgi:3',5'-cyclic AMP phosphodiesterase CpdA